MEIIQKEGNPNDYAYLASQIYLQDLQKYLHKVSQSLAVTKRNGFATEMKRTLLSD